MLLSVMNIPRFYLLLYSATLETSLHLPLYAVLVQMYKFFLYLYHNLNSHETLDIQECYITSN